MIVYGLNKESKKIQKNIFRDVYFFLELKYCYFCKYRKYAKLKYN